MPLHVQSTLPWGAVSPAACYGDEIIRMNFEVGNTKRQAIGFHV